MKYQVYVLKSLKDNTIYIGMTNDLRRRISQHNCGKNRSTKHKLPLELIYQESADSRLGARKKELYLKSGCGREFIKSL